MFGGGGRKRVEVVGRERGRGEVSKRLSFTFYSLCPQRVAQQGWDRTEVAESQGHPLGLRGSPQLRDVCATALESQSKSTWINLQLGGFGLDGTMGSLE